MSINKTQEIIIRLNASYKVKHEKFKDFDNSYFKDVYDQASRIVREIIDTGREDFDLDSSKGYTEPISNLIAFNGKRGSGKTSAMLSFCDFLRKFERYRSDGENTVCHELLNMPQKVSFTVLESIDATLVSEPKELIGAVLGKMLVAIKEKERYESENGRPQNIDIRKLKSRLGDIYRSMPASDNMKEPVASGEVLEQLSRSWNQQQAFREAVKKFSNYMIEYKDANTLNYLVIPVDDIDMNLEKGYQLLESIRKYLMAPNVIVMLAADYMQLSELCANAYKQAFKYSLNEELASEYLEKMIPTGRRIYMPELYQEEILYNKRVMVQEETGEIMPIKELILGKVWEHTGLLLDRNSGVTHWLLPHSLRKLSNYMNSMNSLVEFSGKINACEAFNKNISWFYDDLLSRYLCERNQENSSIISAIEIYNKSVLNRKFANLLNELRECLALNILQTDNEAPTYGTLLGQLFYSWINRKNIMVVQTVSFAVSLHLRTYIYAIENADNSNKYKEELISLTGGDVWGKLENISINQVGISKKTIEVKAEQKVEEMLEKIWFENDCTAKSVLLWAMLLGLRKGEKGLEGFLQFGNLINFSFDYNNQLERMKKLLCDNTSSDKHKEIEEACDEMMAEYSTWEKNNQTVRLVPFDSMEFMFDLYERLYGNMGVFRSIDIQETTNNYGTVFMQEIETVEETLREYDLYYAKIRRKYEGLPDDRVPVGFKGSYAEVYKSCPVIKYIKEDHKAREILFYGYSALFTLKPSVAEGEKEPEKETKKATKRVAKKKIDKKEKDKEPEPGESTLKKAEEQAGRAE